MNEDLTAARARNIRDALAEDIGNADWTAMLVPAGRRVRAHVQVRESAILCGREWFDGVFAALDPTSTINWHYAEGAAMQANTRVCDIEADGRALLTAERSALNFLQLLSSTATITRAHVDAIEGASPTPDCSINWSNHEFSRSEASSARPVPYVSTSFKMPANSG